MKHHFMPQQGAAPGRRQRAFFQMLYHAHRSCHHHPPSATGELGRWAASRTHDVCATLPFPLLTDPDHQLAEALGTWGEKTFMGKTYIGTLRSTFVVGADGTIQHVYPNVKPDEHAQEILRDLGKA